MRGRYWHITVLVSLWLCLVYGVFVYHIMQRF